MYKLNRIGLLIYVGSDIYERMNLDLLILSCRRSPTYGYWITSLMGTRPTSKAFDFLKIICPLWHSKILLQYNWIRNINTSSSMHALYGKFQFIITLRFQIPLIPQNIISLIWKILNLKGYLFFVANWVSVWKIG